MRVFKIKALQIPSPPAPNTVELSTLKNQIVRRQPFAAETNRLPCRHKDADLLLNSTVLPPAPLPQGEGEGVNAYARASLADLMRLFALPDFSAFGQESRVSKKRLLELQITAYFGWFPSSGSGTLILQATD
ncbi:MAG: hypothetical protein DM484_30355 [Candidatus Methylumidiphilus alinenensis]|uniref:Uncharacterized protein n=1 Tax=Candidatus Methylumidiphilus alinenensis TaxID=2202197 RepID=A0A2W4RYS1_9GAMM|nr:MAG: hypothetical protein DM484_30355 [Candidatus Methylumidiphilus alinenensis]